MAEHGWGDPVPEGTNPPGFVDPAWREQCEVVIDVIVAREIFALGAGDFEQILDTFPVLERRERKEYGEYRTKRLLLECYDAMVKSEDAGEPHRTMLDLLLADSRSVHPARVSMPSPSQRSLRLVREPAEDDKYRTCVPVYSLKAAAGAFGNTQEVESEGWVEIPDHRLRPGMFVAKVVGRSMEPRIPDGAWCIFRSDVQGSRNGKTLLVQHHDISDPDTGGAYTVKRYRSQKAVAPDGSWAHTSIRLEPENPHYDPIALTPRDEGEVAVIAELIDVLPPDAFGDRPDGPPSA
jgi:SOS-response transcriptional repressor LexA